MPEDSLRLLSLDSGGVRGLSSLMILQKLMETIDNNKQPPTKPCEYFDMIGGTSTGGIIAIMLGRLRMSVDDCIKAYTSLFERVFVKHGGRFGLSGQLKGRFDSRELELAIKEVLKQNGFDEDELPKDELPKDELPKDDNTPCRVFVCTMAKSTSDIVSLASYRSDYGRSEYLDSVKIWEAARATSAAPTFFNPITLGRYGEAYVDGALGSANPVKELWKEAGSIWASAGTSPLEDRVQCVVSIGPGVPSLEPFRDNLLHIGKSLTNIATETERTAETFQRYHPRLYKNGQYFRFNVLRGLENIGLEEPKKVSEIAAATGRYYTSDTVVNAMRKCATSVSRVSKNCQ